MFSLRSHWDSSLQSEPGVPLSRGPAKPGKHECGESDADNRNTLGCSTATDGGGTHVGFTP